MQAVFASLFNDELENVPNFIETESWFDSMNDYAKSKGYEYKGMLHNKKYVTLINPIGSGIFKKDKWYSPGIVTKNNLKKNSGVDGFFYAGVCSPGFFSWAGLEGHAVIIDSDFNIVHDPNLNYKDIYKYPLANIIGYNGITDVYLFNKIKNEEN